MEGLDLLISEVCTLGNELDSRHRTGESLDSLRSLTDELAAKAEQLKEAAAAA